MVDYILIGLFGVFALRGWTRGLVREALDVLTLVVGALLAFRFATPIGAVIVEIFDISPEVARIIGGVAAFVAISVGAGIAAHFLHRTIRILPGLTLLNRLGGAALGVVYALVLATLGLTLIRVLPGTESVEAHVEESIVAAELTDPQGPVQRTFSAVLGDRVMQTILVLEELVGERSVAFGASDSAVSFPGVGDGLVHPADDTARELFDAINEERAATGVALLQRSDALAEVAAAYADEMYRTGNLAHQSTVSGSPEDRLEAAGISTKRHAENLALGATGAGVHDALMASPTHRATLLSGEYDRVGIGVVSGPFGLMTVQIFAG
jgi:uncharacterized protein YkwD